jgi:hypothetical protein
VNGHKKRSTDKANTNLREFMGKIPSALNREFIGLSKFAIISNVKFFFLLNAIFSMANSI